MNDTLSLNTRAILLLTAPLMVGRSSMRPAGPAAALLSLGEYKRLARRLRELSRQPADLLAADGEALWAGCADTVEPERLRQLLGRGFLLGQAVERWQARSIWVVSRADAAYPARLKARLKEDCPPILYGCGNRSLLDREGLAVVGSRNADDALLAYARGVGALAAAAGVALVSGGARGIDGAATDGALATGGAAVSVLAEGLEPRAMRRENRNAIAEGRLLLLSPYDPNVAFNVGNAMQRNKLIYALSDAALVVCSDADRGGTWAGAQEQLDKLRLTPVYVRATGARSEGLEALCAKGAQPWPEPADTAGLMALLRQPTVMPPREQTLSLLDAATMQAPAPVAEKKASATPKGATAGKTHPGAELPDAQPPAMQPPTSRMPDGLPPGPQGGGHDVSPISPADELQALIRQLAPRLLAVPKKEDEIAAELGVATIQARAWLTWLVAEGLAEKGGRPVKYRLASTGRP